MPGTAQSLVDVPRFKKFVCPTYPSIGIQAHVEGVVLIEIVVAKNGEPAEIRVLKGPPMLISATMEAVKQWQFWPYRLNGEAVEVSMRMKFVFAAKPRFGHRCHLEHRPNAAYVNQLSDGRSYIP
jgi:TonB family protein